ncbi:ABC transporter permease [Microbacterium sp. SLBN-111]|uniref:ABC transporter permease n=1 Tax=Microbacterium sp. SLBN-111 TaxID=3377733 RepID=UPI003C794E55
MTTQATPERRATVAETAPTPRRRITAAGLERWTLPAVFVLAIALFSILKPAVFPTPANFIAIVQQNLPLLVVVGGLCVVLALREFDLSFGFVAGAAGALAVQSMVLWQANWIVATLLGIVFGAVLGAVNGILVAYTRLPSFIGTLATGATIQGIMLAISSQTIFSGIAPEYTLITGATIGTLPIDIVVVAVLLVAIGALLRFTVFGRHASAIGDNPVAARIAGVNVSGIQVLSFTLVGACAGISGVLLTSQAGQYYPDPGSSLLLPAFAAAYLSLSLGRGWRFNVGGAVLGALFLAVVSTGVTMLNQPSWLGQLLQGLILLIAILALNRRRGTR